MPGLLAELPRDPYHGGPVGYRVESGGEVVLYTFGWDGTDDGGVHDPDPDVLDLVLTRPRPSE